MTSSLNNPAQAQALYKPKKLQMLWSLMNPQRQAPQPKLLGNVPQGQQGNLAALAKGTPVNMPGRPIGSPRIGGKKYGDKGL